MVGRGSASVVSFAAKTAPQAATALDGLLPPIPFDMLHYRALFPDRWAAFLQAHFRGAYHVAVFFDVDSKTARDWLSGKKGPHGAFVIRAVAAIHGALAELMAAA